MVELSKPITLNTLLNKENVQMEKANMMVLSENINEVARETKNLVQYYGADKPMKEVIEKENNSNLNDNFKFIVNNFLFARGMK